MKIREKKCIQLLEKSHKGGEKGSDVDNTVMGERVKLIMVMCKTYPKSYNDFNFAKSFQCKSLQDTKKKQGKRQHVLLQEFKQQMQLRHPYCLVVVFLLAQR